MADGRYAAIDIGTVTCRLLVAQVAGGRVHDVWRGYRVTNLGEGVDATGVLSQVAMARVDAALAEFLAERDRLNAEDDPVVATSVVATSAARDARNADAFEALLMRRGLALQVASGAQEAALTFAGAAAGVADAIGDDPVMVVDVGGGSTEVSLGRAGAAPVRSHSFDIGCRRATERFFASDPPSADELAAARAWMREQFEMWARANADAFDGQTARMVAVAGTATSAVSIRERMEVYDASRVHGSTVTADDMERLDGRLAGMTLAQRERVMGLDPKRAPVIVAGFVILEEVMRAFRMQAFTVSESDILQGIVMKAAGLI